MKTTIKNKRKGFALLYAVVLISIISAITAGLANTTIKQSIISSVAKDSQAAFYASDTATECAFYAYYKKASSFTPGSTWKCGNIDLNYSASPGGYTLTPTGAVKTTLNPCFDIQSKTTINPIDNSSIVTTMLSSGYNFCNTTNPRSVQRTIKATIE